MQPAHGDERPGGGRRREPAVVVVALAEPGEELRDVRLADLLRAVDAAAAVALGVAHDGPTTAADDRSVPAARMLAARAGVLAS